MKTPSILARSALEGRLQFQVLQQVLYHIANVKGICHWNFPNKDQEFWLFFFFKWASSFLLTTFPVSPLPNTTEHGTLTIGWSGSLKHKPIINKAHLVFLHAEAHMQTTETRCVGLLHLCTIQETDAHFLYRGTQQHFPLLLSNLSVTFVIANGSKRN